MFQYINNNLSSGWKCYTSVREQLSHLIWRDEVGRYERRETERMTEREQNTETNRGDCSVKKSQRVREKE